MDKRFDDLFDNADNEIFQVVFYPDRVYHAAYLNATRSTRYRYNVHEVRNAFDITVMKAEVYLDGVFLSNVLRVEYRAGRLTEVAREQNRMLGDKVGMYLKMLDPDLDFKDGPSQEGIPLHYDKWINAYQVEIWTSVEPPAGSRHDVRILDQIGLHGPITSIYTFKGLMAKLFDVRQVEVAFHEARIDPITRKTIAEPTWDNNYLRSYQAPTTREPSAAQNTLSTRNYLLDFRRGYFFSNLRDLEPVRYRNAMMDPGNPDAADDNIIEMRWIVQREFASSLVFFHEVTIPPGKVEGTHRHIGTEELYCITEGSGIAYLGEDDDPNLQGPLVDRHVYGFDQRACRELAVKPGSVIYTKSGGIHGIRNNSADTPLRFVAFLYHTV